MLISINLTKIDMNQHPYFLAKHGNKYKTEWKFAYF